jgi:lysophospholipase L1-like esterase
LTKGGFALGTFASSLALLGLSTAASVIHVARQASRSPEGAVDKVFGPPPRGKRRLICAGDSLTHGVVSFDFVGALRARLGSEMEVLNAGVNGDLAFNLAERLDAIVALAPTDVVVLIGTNDLCGAEDPVVGRRHRRLKRLPELPTREFFETQLARILRGIRERTAARLVVVTPPLLGEDLSHPAHARLCTYAARIGEMAREYGAGLVPLHDAMATALRASGHVPRPGFHAGIVELTWMAMVPVQRYLFGRTYDQIARTHGLWGSPDLVHLTESSGAILVDLLERELRAGASSLPPEANPSGSPPP